MENDKKSKIHELETENAELSKKLGIAQDMTLNSGRCIKKQLSGCMHWKVYWRKDHDELRKDHERNDSREAGGSAV